MSFIKFLTESVTRSHIKELTEKETLDLLKDCKDFSKNKSIIYRGMDEDDSKFYLLDTSKSKRPESIDGASDAYRIILDHTFPSKFPKRSRSFVCTTSKNKASDYGNVFVILPFDNSKIANSNQEDIWDTLYDGKHSLEDFAKWFNNNHVKLDNDYEELVLAICQSYLEELPTTDLFEVFYDAIDSELDEDDSQDIDEIYEVVDTKIKELFDPYELDFDVSSPINFKNNYPNSELWIAEKMLAIPLRHWNDFKTNIS